MKAAFSAENIKGFFLKHVEKIVLGIIGLCAILMLAGTPWASYQKTPGELTSKLTTADQIIEGSQFTDEGKSQVPAG